MKDVVNSLKFSTVDFGVIILYTASLERIWLICIIIAVSKYDKASIQCVVRIVYGSIYVFMLITNTPMKFPFKNLEFIFIISNDR